MIIRHNENYKWDNIPMLAYKEDTNCFKNITRQVLLDGAPALPCQLRYFEIAPGGYSTLEQHEHVHFVVIFRGGGKALVGKEVYDVQEKDVIEIPSFAWHQFQATSDSPLGFLCLVNIERDRPRLPTEEDLNLLRQDSNIAAFIKS